MSDGLNPRFVVRVKNQIIVSLPDDFPVTASPYELPDEAVRVCKELLAAFELGHLPNRMRILWVIGCAYRQTGYGTPPKKLVKVFELAPSTVTHHVKRLEEAGLIYAEWSRWPNKLLFPTEKGLELTGRLAESKEVIFKWRGQVLFGNSSV